MFRFPKSSGFKTVTSLGLAVVLWVTAPNLIAQKALTTEGAAQINLLLEEKASRNQSQQKISSQILFAIYKERGADFLQQLPNLRITKLTDANGMVLIDIDGTVTDGLQAEIASLGGKIINAHPKYRAIRAQIPLMAVEDLAALNDVATIRPADTYMTNVTTEGDVSHGTDIARAEFGVDGSGVGVGAMSDSVDELATLQGMGELPAGVTVLPGQSGNPGTSEGTALLEIIHDMAPGSDLFFATGGGGLAQMAQNILDLQAAGCKVIVDDVTYFSEPVFQDGVIAQAVDQVVETGTLYFTSAGNSGNFNDGTSGVWEGLFNPTSVPPPLIGAGSAHDFGGGDVGNEITFDPPFFITLQWNDPQDGSDTDFNLFLLSADMSTVVAASTSSQTGIQDPFEIIDSRTNDDTGLNIVVTQGVLPNGPKQSTIHVNTHRGMTENNTPGQIFGHGGATNAITVGAVFRTLSGLFDPNVNNQVETFSSDGPREIFFDADGNLLDTPIVRQKPDVVAADGVSTASSNFTTFFGTSASAPHSAAIAALFLELFPSIPIQDAMDIFNSTALDIEDPGFDRDSGNGIMMGNQALGDPIFTDGFESGNTSAWTK